MDSLSRSAESLLTSAKRLEQEMKRETSYWRQVLAIKEAGWPICRIPGERQTLGVRFGFTEGRRIIGAYCQIWKLIVRQLTQTSGIGASRRCVGTQTVRFNWIGDRDGKGIKD